jgi:hypothetical protein
MGISSPPPPSPAQFNMPLPNPQAQVGQGPNPGAAPNNPSALPPGAMSPTIPPANAQAAGPSADMFTAKKADPNAAMTMPPAFGKIGKLPAFRSEEEELEKMKKAPEFAGHKKKEEHNAFKACGEERKKED